MRIIRTITELRRWRQALSATARVVFVPTMGALHAGHGHLVQLARQAAGPDGCVLVSIFVNPKQFGPAEDFASYPRPFAEDARLLRQWRTDILFASTAREMYPQDEAPADSPRDPAGYQDPLGDVLEGKIRPGHFHGVCVVVARLLAMVQPGMLILGQKDYQQQLILRRMIREMNFPVDVLTAPTIREPDGLAMSSRNRRLTPRERPAAAVVYRALCRAKDEILHGRREVKHLIEEMAGPIAAAGLEVQYALPCHADTLAEFAGVVNDRCVLLVAARLGATRLIDNVVVPQE